MTMIFIVNEEEQKEDFSDGGGQPIICPIFPENCMKTKQTWPKKVRYVPPKSIND